jgi:uncharacterized membrane protein
MTSPPPLTATQTKRLFPFWLLASGLSFVLSLLMVAPFFWLGSASGHDFEFHAASWYDAAFQWRQGIIYPRWTAWANHGFGEPRFIFYPPFSWMIGAALTLLLPGIAVPIVFIVLTQTFAGLSAFLLIRRLTSERAALFGAACYVINPNALLLTYIRSDFAEQLACAFFPLLLLAALRLADLLEDAPPRPVAIASLAILFAAIWLSNAPAGVIASYAMALLFAFAAIVQRSRRIILRGGFALALGLGLAAFYIVPAAYEQRWVNIGQALSGGLLPSDNFLFTVTGDPEHTWFNWIASFSALALILLFAVTALASRRFACNPALPDRARKTFFALLALGACASLLTLRITLPLWSYLPKLRFVQFPWRWMSIIALVSACFFAAAIEKRRPWVWLALFVLLSVPLSAFLVKETWWDFDEMPTQHCAITNGTGYDGTDEYDPKGDDHLDLPATAPLVKLLPQNAEQTPHPRAQVQVCTWTTERKVIHVDAQDPARLALRLLNYPAWQVDVNGRPILPERMDDVNQMVIPVDPGSSDIHVRFVRTPDRTVGMLLSLLGALIAAILLLAFRRHAGGDIHCS